MEQVHSPYLLNPRYGVAHDIGFAYLYSVPGKNSNCVAECLALAHIWVTDLDENKDFLLDARSHGSNSFSLISSQIAFQIDETDGNSVRKFLNSTRVPYGH